MSRTVSQRPFWPSYIALLLFILILTLQRRVSANPLWNFTQQYGTTESSMESSAGSSTVNSMGSTSSENWENISTESLENNSTEILEDNSTEISPYTDVYVIKAVVYEIGILTDTDNTTSSESTERQERVDISLYSEPQEDEFS